MPLSSLYSGAASKGGNGPVDEKCGTDLTHTKGGVVVVDTKGDPFFQEDHKDIRSRRRGSGGRIVMDRKTSMVRDPR